MARKALIVSHVVPPAPSGQAVVLFKLLEKLLPRQYVLATAGKYQKGIASSELSGKIYTLPTHGDMQRALKAKVRVPLEAALFGITIMKRKKAMQRIIAKEKCDTLIVCTGDYADMAAALRVAQGNPRLRFIPYYFDYFTYQFPGAYRILSNRLERKVMEYADTVIVPNEFTAKRLEERYAAKTSLVRNPMGEVPKVGEVTKSGKEKMILYTGAVYEAQADALRVLAEALPLVKGAKPVLHIATSQTKETLETQGIKVGPFVQKHDHLSLSESLVLQSKADLLSLPLASTTSYPEIIATSCPGKFAEYLASARPIFASVPDDSFVAWYLRENKAGFVSTELDPKVVAKQLEDAFAQPEIANKMAQTGRKVAQRDFSLEGARKAFLEVLNG